MRKNKEERDDFYQRMSKTVFFPDLAQLAAHSNLLSPLLQRHSVMLFYNFFFF